MSLRDLFTTAIFFTFYKGSFHCGKVCFENANFSFARKTLEANQFFSSRAFVWVPICILQNLRHFDMFLTDLVVKISFFICQENPWGKSIPFVKSFRLSTYLYFAKFEAFWHVFDLFGSQNVIFNLPEKPLAQIS